MSPRRPDVGEDRRQLLIVERAHRRHEELALQALQRDANQRVLPAKHQRRSPQRRGEPLHAAAIGLMARRTVGLEGLAATLAPVRGRRLKLSGPPGADERDQAIG